MSHLITRAMLTDTAGNFRPDWYPLAFAKPSAVAPTTDWTGEEYALIVEAEITRLGNEAARWAVEQDVWSALYETAMRGAA